MKINRISVITFFVVNGFLHANLMARLPELKQTLQISNSLLGTLLFCIALGALVSMPVAGWLTTKFGSDRVAKIAGLLFCIAIPLTAASDSIWLTGFCFFLLGISTGSMDVAMNGQAVFVERIYQRPIMSSFHACFSLGMAAGAGIGALFSWFKILLFQHLFFVSAFGIAAIIAAAFGLIKDQPEIVKEKKEKGNFFRLVRTILPIGLIAFCCMTTEGSMADWSAIYMHKIIGEDLIFSAIAFGCFAGGMTLGRIFGDSLTLKLGSSRLLTIDTLTAILGLILVLGFQSPYTSLTGFFLVGLGVATIVPIVFSAAGNTKGVNPAVGIAAATSIGYLGFFVGPPTIGFLADSFNLRIGLCFTLTLLLFMLFLILRYFKRS